MTMGLAIELMHHISVATGDIETLEELAGQMPTGEPDYDEELLRSLEIARANLLRWRLCVGEAHGLIRLEPAAFKDRSNPPYSP